MTHLHYVIASYTITAVGLGGILVWLLANRHQQRSALRRLQQNDKKCHWNKKP
ncbi:MAG: Heme exporter protein D [Candidatus Tokpelaia sp. JSC189]|nr:MAG: Heme exporter protein D [Candidatus Tokpelaia sp. JSC189]